MNDGCVVEMTGPFTLRVKQDNTFKIEQDADSQNSFEEVEPHDWVTIEGVTALMVGFGSHSDEERKEWVGVPVVAAIANGQLFICDTHPRTIPLNEGEELVCVDGGLFSEHSNRFRPIVHTNQRVIDVLNNQFMFVNELGEGVQFASTFTDWMCCKHRALYMKWDTPEVHWPGAKKEEVVTLAALQSRLPTIHNVDGCESIWDEL